MHHFCLWSTCYGATHFVCVQCVYVELLCGPLPRPLTSYAAWQVTNSFLIACTRKIISLFPFLGGTRQDVCAIIIASVPFPASRLLFLEQVYWGPSLPVCVRVCVNVYMCVWVHSKGGLNGPEVLFLACDWGESVFVNPVPASWEFFSLLLLFPSPWERAVCLCVCVCVCVFSVCMCVYLYVWQALA